MINSKLSPLFSIAMAVWLISFSFHVNAANAVKSKPTKERLVLMPIRAPEEDKSLTGAMETALIEGLQQKYEVFSGEMVSQKAHEIFMKESRNTAHKECDETKCMQNIAIAFQSELIATSSITKQDGGYFLALKIENIFGNEAVYSKSLTCANCTSFQAVDRLKELSGSMNATLASPPKLADIQSADKEFWAEIRKSNTAEDYQAYIDQYPHGKFIALAKSRIAKLQAEDRAEVNRGVRFVSDLAKQKRGFVPLNPDMVRIPGKNYELGKYVVTQAQWRSMMGTNPSDLKNCDDCPVEHVSWDDAKAFIQKLNAKTGGAYRLPTEREWTYACMGGESSSYTCSPAKNYDKVNHYSTDKVGQQKANGYGLYDMNGSVRQWMEDLCSNHADGERALSGTAWDDNPNASHNCDIPSNGFRNGFRLARTLP